MVFQTYQDVELAMNQLVQEEFINSEFLQTLKSGSYTITQIQHFSVQYSYYSRHFPLVLGAAIAAMAPFDSWWVPLADNLWDEAGHGKPGRSHEQLYKTFLLSAYPHVELDERGLPMQPMSPAVLLAIQTFIDFFRDATPLEAMAAVGLGSELFAGTVMGDIANGLRHPNYNEPRLNLLFWNVHADEHEPRHYQLCKDVLQEFTQPEELQLMYTIGMKIARSEALMYRSLHHEMLQIKD